MNQQPNQSRGLRPFKPVPFGRYTLLLPISTGGMGEIFLARLAGAQGFEKLCVIKKILPQLAQDADFVSRFVNEAKTLGSLSHGNIAQVLDMGVHAHEPFLALEYIDGKDLRKVATRARERGVELPVTFVLYVASKVLDALAYTHRKRDEQEREIGLVHRDVSPPNVLVSYEGDVKVIDFGLAKSSSSEAKTNPSIILGKFLYMSPEQARQGAVDRRSDLYSLGICLYELLCGTNPFESVSPTEMMDKVSSPQVPLLQQVAPRVDPAVCAVVMKAIAPDPAARYQSAEEFRGQLMAALLRLDPQSGAEQAARVMRELFASEHQTERKLLQSLREAASSREHGSGRVTQLRPSKPQARPAFEGPPVTPIGLPSSELAAPERETMPALPLDASLLEALDETTSPSSPTVEAAALDPLSDLSTADALATSASAPTLNVVAPTLPPSAAAAPVAARRLSGKRVAAESVLVPVTTLRPSAPVVEPLPRALKAPPSDSEPTAARTMTSLVSWRWLAVPAAAVVAALGYVAHDLVQSVDSSQRASAAALKSNLGPASIGDHQVSPLLPERQPDEELPTLPPPPMGGTPARPAVAALTHTQQAFATVKQAHLRLDNRFATVARRYRPRLQMLENRLQSVGADDADFIADCIKLEEELRLEREKPENE